MATEAKKTILTTHLVLLLSLAAAMLLATFGRSWIQSDAGGWVISLIGIAFVAALLLLTALQVGGRVPDNTLSALLRQSTVKSTFWPWGLSVYAGRWFHPVDGLESPLGLFGPIVLMAATWGIIVLGDVLAKEGKRIWPWLVVAVGFVVGSLCWPA